MLVDMLYHSYPWFCFDLPLVCLPFSLLISGEAVLNEPFVEQTNTGFLSFCTSTLHKLWLGLYEKWKTMLLLRVLCNEIKATSWKCFQLFFLCNIHSKEMFFFCKDLVQGLKKNYCLIFICISLRVKWLYWPKVKRLKK